MILNLSLISVVGLVEKKALADTNCIVAPLGDINRDQKIDLNDVTLLKDCIIKKAPATADCSTSTADVNRDGKVSSLDVIVLQATVLGKCTKPTPPPTPTPSQPLYGSCPGYDSGNPAATCGDLASRFNNPSWYCGLHQSNAVQTNCPVANLVGSCTNSTGLGTVIKRFYKPAFTAASAKQDCFYTSGSFTP